MSRSRRSTPKTVLVVEPDPGIRKLIGEILEVNGYHVLMAHDLPGAMATSARHQRPIALIIVDLPLPEVAGDRVIEHLDSSCASAKVLHLTEKAASATSPRFLRMPFTVNMLMQKVYETLGDRRLTKLPAEPSPPPARGRPKLRVLGGHEPPHDPGRAR